MHVKEENGLEYLQFKKLNEYNLKHCITLRYGGFSEGIFKSLNFRILGMDLKENVFKNLKLVCNKINIDENKVYKANQAHTNNVLYLNEENLEEYKFEKFNKSEYDAYIYNEKDIATFVTTADCIPIIIYDPIKNAVANIHSGWKGTISKIYIEAIKEMKLKFNSKVSDLIVCLGPSIQKCCFSSEEESFKEKFTNVWGNEENYITYDEKNKNKFYIDMPYLVKNDMLKLGVLEENIVLSNICTLCNKDDFFSYRYNTKNNIKDYGTMATLVGL